MTYIVGINSAYHESSVCLVKDGVIVAVAEEERFNRKKHAKPARVDNPDELPLKSLDYCLKKAGIDFAEVEHVGYSLDPKARRDRNIRHTHPYEVSPGDFGSKEGEELFYRKNINVEHKLRELGFNENFLYLKHHDCHAASSFFVSGFNEAAVLVVDGIGEFESTTLYKGIENKLTKIGSIDFPNSLGFLWEKLCKYFGFGEYGACKMMGLASYGNPKTYRTKFKDLVTINDDGTFTIDDGIIQFRNENYVGLESLFSFERRDRPIQQVTKETKKYADLAATLQAFTQDIIIRLAKNLKNKTGLDKLCLSGGVALNCVANGKLLGEKIFDDIFIQPAAHDAGTAIGAAFYIWNQVLDNPRTCVFRSACLGSEFTEGAMKEALDKSGLEYAHLNDIEKATARLLADGQVVAWFQGAMEIGPRALGNRSLLCDPRRKDVVALLNHKVKHREPFRPFCPSVLAEKASEWFDIDEELPSAARYMLSTFRVLDYRKGIIPAVVHIDGTARIQAVEKAFNSRYRKLIEEFENLTGIPVLLNTSFNDCEPIVCSPEDAIHTFKETHIDNLVLGNFLVTRR